MVRCGAPVAAAVVGSRSGWLLSVSLVFRLANCNAVAGELIHAVMVAPSALASDCATRNGSRLTNPPDGIGVAFATDAIPLGVLRHGRAAEGAVGIDDRRLRSVRKDNKITAILHTGYPIRHWDKDLGPAAPHLLSVDLTGDEPKDLTPGPAGALWDTDFDVSADGRFVVTSWQQPAAGASKHAVLVRIDTDSGERAVIADETGADLWSPVIAPDGSAVAYVRESYSTPKKAPRITLCCLRFGGDRVDVAPDWTVGRRRWRGRGTDRR